MPRPDWMPRGEAALAAMAERMAPTVEDCREKEIEMMVRLRMARSDCWVARMRYEQAYRRWSRDQAESEEFDDEVLDLALRHRYRIRLAQHLEECKEAFKQRRQRLVLAGEADLGPRVPEYFELLNGGWRESDTSSDSEQEDPVVLGSAGESEDGSELER